MSWKNCYYECKKIKVKKLQHNSYLFFKFSLEKCFENYALYINYRLNLIKSQYCDLISEYPYVKLII